ncbi:helix-turn-helix domain-containing protein [Paenibacillus arenilitoris]|uniref:Helix-turn-helix domain-containing protein n=1 Tax=Paenibacillus arenilitoris TaxID=2772299 RepID=A0A927H9K8_9BACL|nr:helix-turn-helix domain-containing protein [Paenibacillus arenilitoris]MBD2871714.1 helix-turn-helix domain-containing protein [Paenibacillus arenilitoris]
MKTKLSSRFYKYLISYMLLMLIILLAAGSLAYGRLSDLLQRNADSVSASILAEVKLKSEAYLQEMERIALQIPMNPQLNPYALAQGGYESYQALKQMRMYATSSSFIYDMAVGYGGEEAIQTISSNGTYDYASFLQSYAFGQPYAAMIEEHVKDSKEPLIVSRRTHAYGSVSPFLLYAYPFPGSRGEELRFATFVIREQHFTSMIHRVLQGYDGYFYMLDRDNRLITSTGFGRPPGRQEQWLELVTNDANAVDGKQPDASSVSRLRFTSEANGWTYVLVMPKGQFLKETRSITRLYVLSVLGIFVFGLLLSYMFARQNYRPWRLLASTVKSEGAPLRMTAAPAPGLFRVRAGDEPPTSARATSDEYSIVAKAFHELTRENSSLYSRMKQGSRLLKEQYVLSMIRGEESKRKETAQMLDDPRFLLLHPSYAVMLLRIDNSSRLMRMNSQSQLEAQIFALMNIAEELAERLGGRYTLQLSEPGSVALVLNLEPGHGVQHELEVLAGQIIDVYARYFRYSVTAGIGSVVDDRSKVGQSLKEAEEAAQYRYYEGPGHVMTYASVKPLADRPYHHPFPSENRLLLAIKEGHSAEAAQAIGEIASAMREQCVVPRSSREVWKRIGMEIARSLGDADEEWIRQEKEALRQFWQSANEQLNDIERQLTNLCASLCEYAENSKESKHSALLEQLMQWVHQRYTDCGVSLETVADEAGLSPSYATRFFKNHTGFSLMQYIDKLRMDKAKELLRTTDLKIGEVIERSGYVDEANFRRKFRKQEGVSPIKYRSISRLG